MLHLGHAMSKINFQIFIDKAENLDIVMPMYNLLEQWLATQILIQLFRLQEQQKKNATFKINSAKLYVPVVIFSTNNNTKLLENITQRFKDNNRLG